MKKDSKTKIASIYSLALFEAAETSNSVDKAYADVNTLLEAVCEDDGWVKYFINPLWKTDSKKSALNDIIAKLKISETTANWLNILLDNNRFAEFKSILQSFKHLYFHKNNIEEVEVQSVKTLSADQNKKLVSVLEHKLNKKVVVNYTINPDLMGGLRVNYGSNMIDDSVSGKINRLEIMMKGGQ